MGQIDFTGGWPVWSAKQTLAAPAKCSCLSTLLVRRLTLHGCLCLRSSPRAQAEQAHLCQLIVHDGVFHLVSTHANGFCKGLSVR